MTEKELLYYEDAIKHEDNIIKIINNSLNDLNNNKIIEFMKNEINNHQKIKNDLLDLLENKINE